MNDEQPIEPDDSESPVDRAKRQIEEQLRGLGFDVIKPSEESAPPTVYVNGVPIGTVDLPTFTFKPAPRETPPEPLRFTGEITFAATSLVTVCPVCGGEGRAERIVYHRTDPSTGETRSETVDERCSRCCSWGFVL